ncbi:stress-activated map kinase-interacting protein 1 [Lutzomyia longipalpis]|uniref:stress-activated map kinase-interacting protein 1 n=1 Tax=Lutzomyia longipalpis TaxID=7200 RepID=UPI0024846055|nr:stress-activated map kinase-interacting protein 1 [Lutzomyia longipalpis]
MATYNNPHWLLCHIRNSFISTDDTGMCEAVMVSEDLPSQYAQTHARRPEPTNGLEDTQDFVCYPGLDQSDDEDGDLLSQSYDIHAEPDIGLHRQRSNTAQNLERMELARRKASKIRNVKCDDSIVAITDADRDALFVRRDVPPVTTQKKKPKSLLSERLQHCPKQTQNKFLEYARFDGTAQTGVSTRTLKIFLTMLPEKQRNYPIQVCVLSTAKIQEFIGLICYKCSIENPDVPLKSVRNYGLYITEEDGEVDSDFPPLDVREPCSKFCFSHLALIERRATIARVDQRTMSVTSEVDAGGGGGTFPEDPKVVSAQQSEDMARMLGHTTMMEAPMYRSYRLHMLQGPFFRTEIQLGISGEKVEIDPVQQKNTKFWTKQRAISHAMNSVAMCEIIERKLYRATFRLVYRVPRPGVDEGGAHSEYSTSASPQAASTSTFKHYNFETDPETAQEIVEKIRNILEVRSSATQREFLSFRERRRGGHGKKSFSLI